MIPSRTVAIGDVVIGGGGPLAVIGGPCVLEDREVNLLIARRLKEITTRLGLPYIFKASYDKGNRAVSTSYRGPMLDAGLRLLAEIREEVGVPVLTDVHSEAEAERAAAVVDVLQVPAYMCMQTSLIEAVARTGRAVNVKKGQFLTPGAVEGIVQKVRSCGNERLLLTERGTTFGYQNLVSDMRALPIMRATGCPVVFDPTHVIRRPGISSSAPEGGEPEFVPHLTRAAVAAGVDALFIETHPDPRTASCDASSMYPLDLVEELLTQATSLHELVGTWDLGIRPRGTNGFLA